MKKPLLNSDEILDDFLFGKPSNDVEKYQKIKG